MTRTTRVTSVSTVSDRPDRTPAAPAGGAGLPPEPRPQEPLDPPRPRSWRRIVLGCLIVLLCAAGASAKFFSGELQTLRSDLSINPSLHVGNSLAPAGFGGAQTLLLVGNDQRKHTTTTPVLPHANEMLLVRLDPNKPYISMMSIPRELMVPIHVGGGIVNTRLNAALTYGGIQLLVKTIKQVTGLSVNHVIEIDFNHFKDAVNEIGCVYSTVDRRYYHVNVPGGPQYQEINLQPGYQRMCGSQALQFVSYRHGDTSIVRDARDQSFLLDVKKQYGPTLVDNVHKFERIFGESVQTDPSLHTTSGIVNLIGTLISSASLRVRQVQFQVTLQPVGANPCSCDTATTQQIAASVHNFLYGSSPVPKRRTSQIANAVHKRGGAARLPLSPVSSAALAQARSDAAKLPFLLEFPRVQDRAGNGTPIDLRTYDIQAPGGVKAPA
jgi:LCP family protein required for cell wall assembly